MKNLSKRALKVIFTIILSIAVLVALFFVALSTRAAGFDANYYANKYPDVVQVFGTDPNLLYKHYVEYGIKENRYQNAEEEAQRKAANANPAPAVAEDPTPVETPAAPTVTPAVTIRPGYSTYVDVNIAAQTVTYFVNGEATLQSPCVTGNVNAKRGTPVGTWQVMCKVPGKYLVGPTWRCWVDRWMQFTPSHCGFHDATWRSNFGGDIYLTNGSHGCVNLPHDFALTLYDNISVGTTVVVH